MPKYEYACKSCGERLEVVQSFTDAPLTECPACGGALRKVFSVPAITFKGSGFYRTDNRTGRPGSESKSDAKADSSPSSDTKTDSSSDKAGSSADKPGSSSDKRGPAKTESTPAAATKPKAAEAKTA